MNGKEAETTGLQQEIKLTFNMFLISYFVYHPAALNLILQ